ncbi:hypothetical protein PG994_008795 [Apiospora phragmitis]|uniref:AMP-activated protein kinase glycogen-binding domain-containing protein n=1 Tax=Apiospora phragmitis TaxID=2905665 RepID=A0ABR1UHH2_9PEZI
MRLASNPTLEMEYISLTIIQQGSRGCTEAVIPVFPGTHHIKFLVDGSMETSIHLPTTVDFGNNLVNYIEVSGETAATRTFDGGASPPRDAEEAAALPSRPGSQDKLTDAENVHHKRTLSIPPPEVFSERLPKYLADFDQPRRLETVPAIHCGSRQTSHATFSSQFPNQADYE